MRKLTRMRTSATFMLTAAALGAALLVSPAAAQDEWRTPTDYRSYDDDQLITPSESAQPLRVSDRATANWNNHIDRVARLEGQLESLKTTRVAELEAEIAKLNERFTASGDTLVGMGGSCGSCGRGGFGCNPCCGEPCCPPVQNGLYAGIEFLFLKPHFENSTAFISSQSGDIASRSDARSHEFDYDWDLSTRVVLGYNTDCGLGVRTRYFHYDHDSNSPSIDIPNAGDAETPAIAPILGNGQQFFMDNGGAAGFSARHSLELQTWDWEVTNQLCFCRSLVTVGGGLRYVLMEQRYRADALHANGHVQESLYNDHDFEGIGPTLAVDMLRPINCCSGLALYMNARGSVLFGDSSQSYKKVDGTTNAVTESYVRSDGDNSLYIAELGLGVQYTQGIFFARGGYEGQYWSGVGGPTTNEGSLGLHGLSLMLGLNY